MQLRFWQAAAFVSSLIHLFAVWFSSFSEVITASFFTTPLSGLGLGLHKHKHGSVAVVNCIIFFRHLVAHVLDMLVMSMIEFAVQVLPFNDKLMVFWLQLPYAQSVLTTSYLHGRHKPRNVQRGLRAIRDINIYNQLMHAWCKQACHSQKSLLCCCYSCFSCSRVFTI